MALIFQNPTHDLIVAEMLSKTGKSIGEVLPPATGVLGSALFGGTLGEGDDAKNFAGLLGAPGKDMHGLIPMDKLLQGGFGKDKTGEEKLSLKDKANNLIDKVTDIPSNMVSGYSSLDNKLGGILPNFRGVYEGRLNKTNKSLARVNEQIASIDSSDEANPNRLKKLESKKDALMRRANRISNTIDQAGMRLDLGGPYSKFIDGLTKVGQAGLGIATAPITLPAYLGNEAREFMQDFRQRRAFKKEEKKKLKKQKGVEAAENAIRDEIAMKKGLIDQGLLDNSEGSYNPIAESISLKDYMDREKAAQELYNANINAPKTLDFIPPMEINPASSSMVDIAPIESPYSNLDSVIQDSPYYDSALATDTGALDNVDTSNIQPLPSLMDRVGTSDEVGERYPVSEETDPNIKLSYPDADIGGPLGGALEGALSPSPEEPDTLGNRNNNPGNIKFAGQEGAVKQGDFAKFDTMEDGWKALYRQVELDTGRGDTIETFIKGTDGTGGYSEDNQDSYIRFISDKVGYPPDTPLSAIDPQDLVSAIAMMEGTIDSTDFAPSLDELEVKSNRNVLDSIIQRGFMPIDQDSIRRQNIQQQNYRSKLRGY